MSVIDKLGILAKATAKMKNAQSGLNFARYAMQDTANYLDAVKETENIQDLLQNADKC